VYGYATAVSYVSDDQEKETIAHHFVPSRTAMTFAIEHSKSYLNYGGAIEGVATRVFNLILLHH